MTDSATEYLAYLNSLPPATERQAHTVFANYTSSDFCPDDDIKDFIKQNIPEWLTNTRVRFLAYMRSMLNHSKVTNVMWSTRTFQTPIRSDLLSSGMMFDDRFRSMEQKARGLPIPSILDRASPIPFKDGVSFSEMEYLAESYFRPWSYEHVGYDSYIPPSVLSNPFLPTLSADKKRRWSSGVQLPDGRIILVPFGSPYIGIYDPSLEGSGTLSYTQGPYTSRSLAKWSFGVYADNKVFFVPHSYEYIGIYDPSTNTYTEGPVAGSTVEVATQSDKWSGGVLSSDGTKIIFSPLDSSEIGVYELPTADTPLGAYTGVSEGVPTSSDKWSFCVSVGTDNVYFIPLSYSKVGIFDSSTKEYSDGPSAIPSVGQTYNKWSSAIVQSFNDTDCIVFVPFNSNVIGIYDPATNSYTDGPVADKTSDLMKWTCAISSPLDGKLLFVPYRYHYFGLYDPTPTDTSPYGTFQDYTDLGEIAGNFLQGLLLSGTSRILLIPGFWETSGIVNLSTEEATFTDLPTVLGKIEDWSHNTSYLEYIYPDGSSVVVNGNFTDAGLTTDMVPQNYTDEDTSGGSVSQNLYMLGMFIPVSADRSERVTQSKYITADYKKYLEAIHPGWILVATIWTTYCPYLSPGEETPYGRVEENHFLDFTHLQVPKAFSEINSAYVAPGYWVDDPNELPYGGHWDLNAEPEPYWTTPSISIIPDYGPEPIETDTPIGYDFHIRIFEKSVRQVSFGVADTLGNFRTTYAFTCNQNFYIPSEYRDKLSCWEIHYYWSSGIVSVIDIIDVPETCLVDTPLELFGTVVPSSATYQDIVWSATASYKAAGNVSFDIVNLPSPDTTDQAPTTASIEKDSQVVASVDSAGVLTFVSDSELDPDDDTSIVVTFTPRASANSFVYVYHRDTPITISSALVVGTGVSVFGTITVTPGPTPTDPTPQPRTRHFAASGTVLSDSVFQVTDVDKLIDGWIDTDGILRFGETKHPDYDSNIVITFVSNSDTVVLPEETSITYSYVAGVPVDLGKGPLLFGSIVRVMGAKSGQKHVAAYTVNEDTGVLLATSLDNDPDPLIDAETGKKYSLCPVTGTVVGGVYNALTGVQTDYVEDFIIKAFNPPPLVTEVIIYQPITILFVTVTPQSPVVGAGTTKLFTAIVEGTGKFPTTVTWTLLGNASADTTIDPSGLLTVSPNETTSSLTVTATSTEDPSKFGSSTVSIVSMITSVTVLPQSPTVSAGATQQFTATVEGTGIFSTVVEWWLNGTSNPNTRIDTVSGLLTVASDETSPLLVVSAVSHQDPSKSGHTSVSVAVATITSISVSPNPASVNTGATQQFTATVEGTGPFPTTVVWSLYDNSSASTTINASTGVLSVSLDETSPSLTVTATSTFDTTKLGSSSVTVVPATVTSVTVSPSSVSVNVGETQRFTAVVDGTGSIPQTVTWTLRGASSTGTTISGSGLLSVALDESSPALTVIATSTQDPTKSGSSAVSVVSADYFTVTFLEGVGTVTPRYTVSGYPLQYSVDGGGTWTDISSSNTTPAASVIKFRGSGRSSLYTNGLSSNAWGFSGSCALSGNVSTLLDFVSPPNTLGSYAFAYMCSNNATITDAGNLQLSATTLSDYCYLSMFLNCTVLVQAPTLPAIILKSNCYAYMFSGCTALTQASTLSAITLDTYCCQRMFKDCTSLTHPPELFATSLADSCYNSMFQGCTSLTSSPELPATTLATSCYFQMFRGCTLLTAAPELPSTDLTGCDSCYERMFQDCTSLSQSPTLPASVLASSSYSYMFSGCTSLQTPPALPATNLTDYCYIYMFENCTDLLISTTPVTGYFQPWQLPSSGPVTTVSSFNPTFNMLKSVGTPLGGTAVPATPSSAVGSQAIYYIAGEGGIVTSVTVDPSSATVNPGDSVQFTATVSGSGFISQSVTWSLLGAISSATTINSSGLLSVSADETSSSLTVTATSSQNPSVSGSSSVSVSSSTITSVSVSPQSPTVNAGSSQQFTATVSGTGPFSTDVAWSLLGKTSASTFLSFSGLLSVATDEKASSLTVTATSYQDSSKSGSSSVSVGSTITSVSVSPQSQTVNAGSSQQFTATVSGTGPFSTDVAWSLTGAISPSTSISSSGLLSVSSDETSSSLTVTATSTQNPSVSGSSSVSVSSTVTSVSVLPQSPTVNAGASQQFTATVSGSISQSVTWSLTGAISPSTSISSSGLLSVSSDETSSSLTVTATSTQNPSVSGSSSVSVSSTVTSVSVLPQSPTVNAGASQQFTATVSGTGSISQSVTWSLTGAISPSTSISSSGLLSVSSDETSSSLTVTATSTQDSTKSGSSTVFTAVLFTVSFTSGTGTVTPQYTATGSSLQYAIDNSSTWTDISSGDTTVAASIIKFRGTGRISLFTWAAVSNPQPWSFSNTCSLSGNINTLLDYTNPPTTLGNYAFTALFDSCTSLVDVSQLTLPATTLADYCYVNMFYGCTSLTAAPDLPATTLATACYASMFSGCTSLTTPPALPAISLAENCYSYMFNACTSLEAAPSILPALTLFSECYSYMFAYCTSLVSAPELPATTLADECYSHMFFDCTALDQPIDLPATTLFDYCYASLFENCTSLRMSLELGPGYSHPWTFPSTGPIVVTASAPTEDMFKGNIPPVSADIPDSPPSSVGSQVTYYHH